MLSPWLTTAKSRNPSPLKSAITTPLGFIPTANGEPAASVKVPSKFSLPNNTLTVFDPLFATTRSAGCTRCVGSVWRKILEAMAEGNCSLAPSTIGDPAGAVKFPLSLLNRIEIELSAWFPPPGQLAIVVEILRYHCHRNFSHRKSVRANTVEETAAPMSFPRLVDNGDNVTGNRCPTKMLRPCILPRIRICRPLFTGDNAAENVADALGIVSKSALPPPTGNIRRTCRNTRAEKPVLPKSTNWRCRWPAPVAPPREFSGKACTLDGGVMQCLAVLRSTSSNSISSITSRRDCCSSLINCRPAYFIRTLPYRQSMVRRVVAMRGLVISGSPDHLGQSSGATVLSSRNVAPLLCILFALGNGVFSLKHQLRITVR